MQKPITVVALGPDAKGLLTLEAAGALRAAEKLLLRTGRHGVAEWLASEGVAFDTLDALYDGADDFDVLTEKAADAVLHAAEGQDSFCYAVPDPITDTTVVALRKRDVPLKILCGVTQASVAQAQAVEAGLVSAGDVITMPAVDFDKKQIDPSLALLLTEINSQLTAGDVKLALLDIYAPSMQVLYDGQIISLDELDRQRKYSHLSSVYIPKSPMAERTRYTFGDLMDVMARLRRPGDGCPWDIEQTHETLRRYVIEEAYELVDAIDKDDLNAVADELGDVMLQVVFHAQVAKEHGEFDITDVTTAICHKMITRHAHIFGDIVCETSDDVLKSWAEIKKKEKGHKQTTEVMRDVPGHLPALMRASKVQSKAKQVGFDWEKAEDALAKVHEEADEVRAELDAGADPTEELGDLLFAVVNASRLAGVEPELAMGSATEKFIRRFAAMEQAILADGKQMSGMNLPEMDVYWEKVKRAEKEQMK